MKKCPYQTAAAAAVADNQNSLAAGPRGPVLLQVWQLLEKLAHQNRERIPERVVHAKNRVAYGTLAVTKDITPRRSACSPILRRPCREFQRRLSNASLSCSIKSIPPTAPACVGHWKNEMTGWVMSR